MERWLSPLKYGRRVVLSYRRTSAKLIIYYYYLSGKSALAAGNTGHDLFAKYSGIGHPK
jgi:hypothetical protein